MLLIIESRARQHNNLYLLQVEGNPDGTVFSKEKSGSDNESSSESDSSSEEEEEGRKSVRVKHMKHVSKVRNKTVK